MFKEIGQFASLMKNLPRLKEEMDKLQGRLAQITAEGDAYILECRPCGRSASAAHETLVNIMLARQDQHSPANST